MSIHSPIGHDIPHSPPTDVRFTSGPIDQAAVIQARLNEIARRNPTAVIGALEHWLGPQSDAVSVADG